MHLAPISINCTPISGPCPFQHAAKCIKHGTRIHAQANLSHLGFELAQARPHDARHLSCFVSELH